MLLSTLLTLILPISGPQESADKAAPKPIAIGSIKNLSSVGSLYLAGQPQPDDLPAMAKKGVKRVISLRSAGEVKWDEPKAVKESGMEYVSIPIRGIIAPDAFKQVRELLADGKPTLLHCGSAVRVGAVWLPFRVLDQGVDLETAVKESAVIGLPKGIYLEQAVAYIKANDQEKSVKPGINEKYLAKDLKIEEWVKRFEGESREIYSNRVKIVEACNIKPGMRIADIGSGTGLYTRLFADKVGEKGWVYAVDIVPAFLKHILAGAAKTKTENVSAVLCAENSIRLPGGSVDLVFICDAYHHFEYPRSTMQSIRRALKPDGTLVVIDFERIEGVSRPFVMGHVRAGKTIFRKEIEDAGFELIEELEIDGLEENYFLRFKRK
ncbi:MAG: methyltransferase domain-containing protein [Planctomycetaceae bacterium]